MKNIRFIGLTGGIGSGKTTVARLFEAMGFAVYYADERARHLLNTDAAVKAAVNAALGEDVYLADGKADRMKIASLVFNNPTKLQALNAVIHPAVKADRETWMRVLESSGYQKPFALTEAAILFESGVAATLDGVIVISAPEDLRLRRVMERDGSSELQVRDRMANQLSEEERLRRASFVIVNDGQQLLIPQVQKAIAHFA